MDSGPSASTRIRTHCQSTVTTYYPSTNERTPSQGSQSEPTERHPHGAHGQDLVGQLVTATVWRDVLVWHADRGKGKGRMVGSDVEMTIAHSSQSDRVEKERSVSSTSSANIQHADRSPSASTPTRPAPTRCTWVSYIPDLQPPPARSAFSWMPDVPILEWGEPPTVEEAMVFSAEDESRDWWFESDGRLHFSPTGPEADTLREARRQLRERERAKERDRIRNETVNWKGDWTMMGKAVDFTPQPHYSPFLYPSDHSKALPPLAGLTAVPSHAFSPLLPASSSAPPFPPPSPGVRRGRWIIPINGPVLGLPPSSLVSSARLVDDPDRIARAEDTLRKRTAAPPTPNKIGAVVKAKTLYWTPTLMVSFHSALTKLRALNALGPVSFKLQRSNIVRPDLKPVTLSTSLDGGSASTKRHDILAGDHWVVWVDLAYALRIRHVLGHADLRIKETEPDRGVWERVVPLRGARLMLLDDEGRVLGFS